MTRFALTLATTLALASAVAQGCGSSSPAPPATAGGSGADAACAHVDPTFASVRSNLLQVSCGTNGEICHSAQGGLDSGQLDLASDPYGALLGADGKGALASNIAGSERGLRRVVPGDPDHSFLIIKLTTKTLADARYGSGMPRTDPGSLCSESLNAIRAWIEQGAVP